MSYLDNSGMFKKEPEKQRDEVAELKKENEELRAVMQKVSKDLEDLAASRTTITDIAIRDGSFTVELASEAVGWWAQHFATMLGDAPNYLEMQFRTRDGLDLIATLQRKSGKSPAELRKEALEELERSRQWWAVRFQRLEDFARAELTPEQQHRFFSIVANGTASPADPPTYAQQMNMLRHELERVQAENRQLVKANAGERGKEGVE
jgi:hypothetical protein